MVGYEGRYKVSNLGNVMNVKTGKILKGTIKQGYICHMVKDENGNPHSYQKHRLVAIAFIPNPNNYPMVNHIDENPLNCMVENLEWCTAKHNANHGTRNNKISDARKEYICEYGFDGNLIRIWRNSTYAKEYYNISVRAIQRCCSGDRVTSFGSMFRYFKNTLGENVQPATDQQIHKSKCGTRYKEIKFTQIKPEWLISLEDVKKEYLINNRLNIINNFYTYATSKIKSDDFDIDEISNYFNELLCTTDNFLLSV